MTRILRRRMWLAGAWLAGVIVVLAVAASTLGPDARAVAEPVGTPLRVLAVGDSITVGAPDGGWRPRLAALAPASQPLQISSYAVGGWTTNDVLPGLAAALLATQPDLVMVFIGTNDTGDVAGFEYRYNRILATVEEITEAKIVVSFVQYSALNWPVLANGEAAVNDAVFRVLTARRYRGPAPLSPRLAGLIDLQSIPGAYLDPGGVHPSANGYGAYAHLIYDGIRATYGWPVVPWTADPPLVGHRP